MKKSTICLFFILTVCCLLSACQGQYPGKKPFKAINGILDLSEWDFGRDGPIKLDGEWEYYEGQLLTPDPFGMKPGPEKTSFREVVGKNPHGKGSATFRLIIKFRDSDKTYGLKPVNFSSPQQLWADGNLLYPSVGTGESPRTILSQFLPLTTTFHVKGQTAQIILQTASPLFVRAGLAHHIEIGTVSQINQTVNNKSALHLFLLGSLLTLAIYHFFLFGLRRNEISTFYLGSLCLLTPYCT